MDLIVVLIVIAFIIIWRRDFKSFIYVFGAIEIFLRLISFIKETIKIEALSKLSIPDSILTIFGTYSNGLFYDILKIVYIVFIGLLDYYLIKYIIKRK